MAAKRTTSKVVKKSSQPTKSKAQTTTPRGGKREGAGRPPGAVGKKHAQIREEAALNGELPHQFLLRVSRGDQILQRQPVHTYYKTGVNKGQIKSTEWKVVDRYPTFEERVDAAKACAQYFAPKLATQTIKGDEDNPVQVKGIIRTIVRPGDATQ